MLIKGSEMSILVMARNCICINADWRRGSVYAMNEHSAVSKARLHLTCFILHFAKILALTSDLLHSAY